MITGGQRSGKSEEAERLALQLSEHPVYMATAHPWDDEFRQRIALHQQRRGPQWINIEEERRLSRHDLRGRVVLIDCVTLWLTNLLFDRGDNIGSDDVKRVLEEAKAEFDALVSQEGATFIFVTNEIGLGGVSDNRLQRLFTDLQGWMNQYIARRADEVTLMVSGIAVRVKSEELRVKS